MRNQAEPSNFAAINSPISQQALDQLFRDARTLLHVASRIRAGGTPSQGLRNWRVLAYQFNELGANREQIGNKLPKNTRELGGSRCS